MEAPQPLYQLKEFAALLPSKGRLVGLDLGDKTIGIAVSDDTRMIASPDLTIYRKKFTEDAETIEAMIEKNGVVGMVLGYPLNMDGTPGPRAQATRAFARSMLERVKIPLLLWDERLSTVAVTRVMEDEADMSRARRAELVDKLAASYLLQGVLDGLSNK